MFASEYGWAKKQVFYSLYPEEVFLLLKNIEKRRLLTMQTNLAISQNPYTKNPKELWDTIKRQLGRLEVSQDEVVNVADSINTLKMAMAENSKIVVKQ